MATTKYTIHKVGTPRIQRRKEGGIEPAGLWWQGTGWGDSDNATMFNTNTADTLPPHGEWVEVYVNEEVGGY
jgi:hypothetical protein